MNVGARSFINARAFRKNTLSKEQPQKTQKAQKISRSYFVLFVAKRLFKQSR
jgi:hypothetical protein